MDRGAGWLFELEAYALLPSLFFLYDMLFFSGDAADNINPPLFFLLSLLFFWVPSLDRSRRVPKKTF